MKRKLAKEAAKLTTCTNCGNKGSVDVCKNCYDFSNFKPMQSLISFEPPAPTLFCNQRGKQVKVFYCLEHCTIVGCLNPNEVAEKSKGIPRTHEAAEAT